MRVSIGQCLYLLPSNRLKSTRSSFHLPLGSRPRRTLLSGRSWRLLTVSHLGSTTQHGSWLDSRKHWNTTRMRGTTGGTIPTGQVTDGVKGGPLRSAFAFYNESCKVSFVRSKTAGGVSLKYPAEISLTQT